ncbi:epoxyqueuosine reductase QueH [Sulfurospirillum oryzae]|uniref:epoxyqueuosine reductase QueH n=1 Tax=Sulfurospirillum oryzae TaxID=2976535 RepID=UPI0021E9974A|nr:epoxyqueuosine reductase QueH [Sulfurospirillum oryzae]
MLVHICCSVDSHFFLQKLQQSYPAEKLVGFFYDPNIHPFSEYELRLLDVKRSCAKLGIVLHVGDYNYESWIEAVRGLEKEPEKGKRCNVCFDNRLEETARKALEIGEKTITTTLLTSPKKSLGQLEKSLHAIAQKYNLEMVAPDFRKGGGTTQQFALAKEAMLYHQDYCGCIFALSVQREQQNRWADELSSPLRPQILPSSIEERIALYEKVMELEVKETPFKLVREKFLNYRLLRAWVKNSSKEVIPSYVLFYSICKKESIKSKVAFITQGVGFLAKEEARFISLETFNTFANTNYKNVKEMLQNPPTVEMEMVFRNSYFKSLFASLSPLIVLDEVKIDLYELFIQSFTYPDIRENLVLIS